jgi:hypothetical protein
MTNTQSPTTRYTTIRDAAEQFVGPSLGDFADDYDVDAIARNAFEYVVDTDEDGTEYLNSAGFRLRPEYDAGDDDPSGAEFSAYWAMVERHARYAPTPEPAVVTYTCRYTGCDRTWTGPEADAHEAPVAPDAAGIACCSEHYDEATGYMRSDEA